MISTVLAMALQTVTPQAQANLTEYATMTYIVGSCVDYVSAVDHARLKAEREAMPTEVAKMLSDVWTDGYVRRSSYNDCKRVVPETMRKARSYLAYPLTVKPDATVAYVNRRFGQ